MTLIAGIFGALIGSFLNVVIYRVPLKLSIVSPPSACPRCGAGIRQYDNVPVISWLILRGKCRDCRTPISVRYPLVELGTALFFAAVAWRIGTSAEAAGLVLLTSSTTELVAAGLVLVAFLYLAAISVALALIDLDTHTLPNAIVLPAYAVGSLLLVAAAILNQNPGSLVSAGVGLAAMWVAYFIMAIAYPGGMGFGDVKLAGILGMFLGYLGWGPLLVGSFSAFLLGGIFSFALILTGRANRKSGIPFGPWMLAGAWLGIFAGEEIWVGYLQLFGLA